MAEETGLEPAGLICPMRPSQRCAFVAVSLNCHWLEAEATGHHDRATHARSMTQRDTKQGPEAVQSQPVGHPAYLLLREVSRGSNLLPPRASASLLEDHFLGQDGDRVLEMPEAGVCLGLRQRLAV